MPVIKYCIIILAAIFGIAGLVGQVIGVIYALQNGSSLGLFFMTSSLLLTGCAGFLLWHNFSFYKYSRSKFSNISNLLPWKLAQETLSTIKHYEKRQDVLTSFEKPLKNQYKKEPGKALQESADKLKRVVKAEAVEIALWDRANNRYHASYVVGKPFAYAMSDRFNEDLIANSNEKAYLHDIIFAGEQFGTIRVLFPEERKITNEDRELVTLYAQYCAVALLNANFTSELIRMKKLSEESIKAKTGFLANLSHEIRGPLGIIINAADLLFEKLCGELNPKQLKTVEMVRKHGNHLLDLVNDVLDYAKAESGMLKPKQVSVSVKDLLLEMSNIIRQQAMQKKQSVNVADHPADLSLLCDKRHIRQIMINLLTNAVKYTPEGGTITISALQRNGFVQISVSDTGVGIPQNQREKVFNVFERVDDPYSSKQIGTGLGMPLTKKLSELNGGSIEFDSTVGAGSTFRISLPLASTKSQLEEKDPMEGIVLDGEGKNMLIVAPPIPERSVFEEYLSNIHFSVTAANEPEETKKLLSTSHFHLILIDDSINGEFGEDPVTFLRTNADSKCAIFFLSSKAFSFDIEEKLKGGVDRYITKPISLRELGAICCDWIRSHNNT